MEGPSLGEIFAEPEESVVAAVVPGEAVPELPLPIITFIGPWGSRSWFVRTNVKYNNPLRPPHVELRRKPGAPMPNVRGGDVYVLDNLRRLKVGGKETKAVVWDVPGLNVGGAVNQIAHFTVHFGWDPVEDYMLVSENGVGRGESVGMGPQVATPSCGG